MTEKKLGKRRKEQLKKMLLGIKEEITHDLKNMTSGNSPDSKEAPDEASVGHGLHMADVATDMYDREFNLGLASNDRELLQKVDAALKRLQDDNYGKCSECGKEIPSVRLEAIPYVETCLKCQEELEANSK